MCSSIWQCSSALQDETLALEMLLALDDRALLVCVRTAAEVEGRSLGESLAAAVGRFANAADHERWLSLSARRAQHAGRER